MWITGGVTGVQNKSHAVMSQRIEAALWVIAPMTFHPPHGHFFTDVY